MKEKSFHKIGWLLFLICSILYTLSALNSRDILGILGGVLFFAACIVFIIPMFW